MIKAMTNTCDLHKLEKYAELRHKLYKNPEFTYEYDTYYLTNECDFNKSFVEYLRFLGFEKYDAITKIQSAYKRYHRKKIQAIIKVQRAFLQWYYSPNYGPWIKTKLQKYNKYNNNNNNKCLTSC